MVVRAQSHPTQTPELSVVPEIGGHQSVYEGETLAHSETDGGTLQPLQPPYPEKKR